jgi:hypothetical protein
VAGYLPPIDKAKSNSTTSNVPVDPIFNSIFTPRIESTNSNTSDLSIQNSLQDLPPSIADLNLDDVLAENKLVLFGGVEGLLQKMATDKLTPCIKTFSYLIELVPGSTAVEEAVIKHAKINHIKLDLTFFNILIKKRCARGAKKDAKVINKLFRTITNILLYSTIYFKFYDFRKLLIIFIKLI